LLAVVVVLKAAVELVVIELAQVLRAEVVARKVHYQLTLVILIP
jgi:hypothetical protein